MGLLDQNWEALVPGEPVVRVPGKMARAIREQIAIRIVSQRLTVQGHGLVDGVVCQRPAI